MWCDEEGDFHTRCNMELVGLEKLEDVDEIESLWKLIHRYQSDACGSKSASRKFLTVAAVRAKVHRLLMPQDYKRV